MNSFDSTTDTLKHIKRVAELLMSASEELLHRAKCHDDSKLEEPEKSIFDSVGDKLNSLTFGSDEYKKHLSEMQPALEHHYKNNSHHPEYYPNGVNGMNLFDLMEMFFDWKAAGERHGGNIYKSIEHCKGRFQLSEQLCEILKNTANKMGY